MAKPCPEPDHATYTFGPFRLFPARQLLLRDGAPVRIGGRALDILTLLVRRSGEIVSKNDLLAFCWPDTFVHEGNLKVNVAALRRILEDAPGNEFIATVAGRGYRFVVPVEIEIAGRPPARIAVASAHGSPHGRALPKRPALIGRADDLARLEVVLTGSRCLTIVGPGGVGKTSVALALGHDALSAYPDGVFFIDLATVGDAQYATAAIAASVGARQRSEDALSEVIDLLADRRVLLILDNCEHLLATMTAIADRLLEALPAVTLLATSREPLRGMGERVYRLPSLTVPGSDHHITAGEAMAFGAVELFVARAQERGGYQLCDADAPLVAAICQRLDGIALAIELAASKTPAFGVPTLLALLEQRFLLLTNGERAAPLRQQTLLATLDWSYRLLSEDEATLLRLLSVFAGAFRLQDAINLAAAAGLDATQTIDALERLTSRSIVCGEYVDSALTYRLLESTRAYAAERLADAGERDRVAHQHAAHVLTVLERAAEEGEWREKRDWMTDYAGRVDDLRNAMSWAFGPGGDRMLGIRLTAAAIPLWFELSSISEMQSRVERALLAVREQGDCPPELMMKLIAARASGMSFAQHLVLDTEPAWRECYRLGVEMGSTKYQLYGLWGLAAHLIWIGRPLEAVGWLHQFLALAEAQADWSAVAEGNRMMGMAEIYIGQIATAKQRLEKLAARHQRPGDPLRFARFQAERGVAIRCSYSIALWISGEPGQGMAVAHSAVERAEATGHVVSQANALAVSAVPIAMWTGDLAATARYLDMLEENGRREEIGIWREVCSFFRSAQRARLCEEGAAFEMKARLDDLIAARNLLRAPMHFSMVAEALLEAGAIGEARAVIEEAHALAREQVANWCMPEILRITGLIDLGTGHAAAAEKRFRLAIARAAEMGALTLEVRAALALAKLLQADNRGSEALKLLETTRAKVWEEGAFADLDAALTSARGLVLVDGTGRI